METKDEDRGYERNRRPSHTQVEAEPERMRQREETKKKVEKNNAGKNGTE